MSGGGDNSRGSWDPLAGVEASRRIVPTPQYKDPLAADVADFLNSCQRVAKALRVYDRNNAIIHQFMDRAMAQLTSVHERQPELLLTVREDRLRFERDPVLINADRQEGIPFILYRNAFRRLTFERGMTRAELLEFLAALTVDFNVFDQTGEDLLTILWRLKLPHLRYFTIDALTTTASVGGTPNQEESDEIERIQGDIDGLVARIYGQTQVDDADLVKGASITREDLEALKEIRQGNEEDLDMLDVSTARAIAEIPKREIAQVKATLDADDRDTLTSRLVDILLHLLFRDRSSVNTPKLIELMQQIFDSVLLAGKVGQATHVIRRLRAVEAADDLQAVHVSKHLMRLLLTETRAVQIVSALNEGKHASAPQEVLELLRAFGPSMGPVLLGVIDAVTSAGNRRLVCELIVELGVPEPSVLLERLQRSSQLVVLDLLAIAQRLSRDELAPILLWAVEHETPKVRAFALLLLRPYPSGVADELVVKALRDDDPNVRASVYRLIGLRKHVSYRAAIEALLREDELWSRDARELMTLLLAYATVAGDEGVPALDKILSPGFFARSRMTSGQLAAAAALGRLGSPAARDALTRGMRTLNSKVREACRRALAREAEPEPEPELTPAHGMVLAEFTRERASDLELSAELGRTDDPLERARHVKPREIQAVPQRAAPRPTAAAAAADAVGVVRRATPTVDTIPERLSRAALTIEDPSERAARASAVSHEAAAPAGGARELDLSDIDALVNDVARLDEPSRLGTGPRQSSLPPPAPSSMRGVAPPPAAATPARGFAPPPAAATPARGFSAPPPAATPARGFSAPPPAATPARGFAAPLTDDDDPPMPTAGLAPPPAALAARAGRGLPFAPTPPSSSSSGIMSPAGAYSAPPPGRALPTASGLVAPPPMSATVGGASVVLSTSGFVHPSQGEEAAWEPGDAAPPPSPTSPVPVWSAPQPSSVVARPGPPAASGVWSPPAPPGVPASAATAAPTWAQPLPVPSAIGPAPTPPASSFGFVGPPAGAAPSFVPPSTGVVPAAPVGVLISGSPAQAASRPSFGTPAGESAFSSSSSSFAPLPPSSVAAGGGPVAGFGAVSVSEPAAAPPLPLVPLEFGFASAHSPSFGLGSAPRGAPVSIQPPLVAPPPGLAGPALVPPPIMPVGAPSLVPVAWGAPLPAPPTAASGISSASAGHPPYATPLPPGPAIPGVGAPPPPVSAWMPPPSSAAAGSIASDLVAEVAPSADEARPPAIAWPADVLPPLPGIEGLPSWSTARAEAPAPAMMSWAHDMERATLHADRAELAQRARAEGHVAPPPMSLEVLPPLGAVLGGLGALPQGLPVRPMPPAAPHGALVAQGSAATSAAPALTPAQGPLHPSPSPHPSAVVPHNALLPPPAVRVAALGALPPSGVAASGRPSFAEGLEDLFVASAHVPPPTAPAPPPPRLPASLPPTWVARSPERSRDLAPLALNPDSGTHPTWDDDSSKEEG